MGPGVLETFYTEVRRLAYLGDCDSCGVPDRLLGLCEIVDEAKRTGDRAADWLKSRADSFSRDSQILRGDGDMPMAVAYQTIADELRKCAAEVTE